MIKEIQSLRGIAIILVIFFHLNENLFFLGFLGVDIFFVISGFIISKNITENYIIKKETSIKIFFIKRFLRLYPSLFLIITISTFLFLILSFRVQNEYFIHIYKSAISSLLGFSNFYFSVSKENYFFNDQNPFLHTWSLSLEEQFYLLSFFFLSIFIKFQTKIKFLFLIIFIIFSLIIFNENNFYHLHYRFYEFLIGSLVYFLPKFKNIKINSLKYFILFLLVISFIFFNFIDREKVELIILFTSVLTSLLVYLLINYKFFLNSIFRNNFFIHLGDLSYTLYLVHFPIIIILKFLTPSKYIFLSNVFVLLISYGLSIIIYRFYEFPLRKSKTLLSFCEKHFLKFIFLLLIYISFMFYLFQKETDLTKFNFFKSDLQNFQNSERSTECLDIYFNFNLRKSDLFNTCNKILGSENIYYLIGDSHAWHLSNGLKNSLSGDFFVTYFNGSRIPKPFFKKNDFSDNVTNNIETLNEKYESINLIFSFHHLHAKKLSNNEDYYIDQIKYYENFIQTVKKINPSIKIFMIQDTPLPKDTAYSCEKFKKIFNDHGICDFQISSEYFLLENEIFLKLKNKLKIININHLFCKSSKCNFYDPNGYPIIWDGSHFTPQSELRISKEMTISIY